MTIDRHKVVRRFVGLARRHAKKKAGPTARARKAKSRKLVISERVNKEKVRLRDKVCRFPLCGCKGSGHVSAMKRVPTVSHDRHKGMGGDPTGEASQPELMLLLCKWRHQDAPVSRHAGTMKTTYRTDAKNDGPLIFAVDLFAVYPGLYAKPGAWLEVARESEPGVLEPLTLDGEQVLNDLAEMKR